MFLSRAFFTLLGGGGGFEINYIAQQEKRKKKLEESDIFREEFVHGDEISLNILPFTLIHNLLIV